ncbi:MAG: hypothetical protein ACEQSF_02750 [Solirubrobacteraceae bacterium]
MKKPFLLILISFLIISCTTQKTLNSLNNGMDKAEVIKILGKPETSSSDGEFIFMKYMLKKSVLKSEKNGYFVKLKDNKVCGYGLMSDLD